MATIALLLILKIITQLNPKDRSEELIYYTTGGIKEWR